MKKPIHRQPILILISLIVVLSLAFSMTAPAYAQKDNPGKSGENQGQGQGQGQGQEKALIKLFDRLQAWQERQMAQLQQAEAVGDLIQEFIDQATLAGYDTESLQQQLDAFKDQIKEARKSYQLAQVSIATHYGIDEKGEIYSVKSTRQMIKVASRSFGASHRLLSLAVKTISEELRVWRLANEEGLPSLDGLDPKSP